MYGWEGGDVTFPGFEAGDYTLEKFSERSADNNFLDGKYHLSPNIDVEKVINHFNQNQAGYELDVEGKQIAQALESYTANEDVYAGYVMTKLQFARLMLLGGVRLENTRVKYQSSEVIYDFEGNLDEIRPIEGSTQYTFVLPQLHAKYEINDQANLRVAVTRSYARPNFQDIVPSQEIDLNAREGSIGNPDLKPVGAWNVDLLGERYFGSVGILSGGVFYKRLSDFIFNQRFETDQYPPADGTTLELTQAQNGDQANLFGFELAYQQNLSFLPGFLKGVSVYANYTFTHSKARIQNREDNTATESIRLPGQARHVGNLSLGYEIGRVNFRISSNFNGEYLSELGGDAAEDLYVKDRMQLDATAAVAINSKIRFFAEFLNITNQPFEVYRGESTRYIQREFYSWWTRVGLKIDF
ncbi:MAG: TonB-dependent receptor [Bacteroidia bacterium]|nr:TonB-dependent receptor [Bacteroidia bacterium]